MIMLTPILLFFLLTLRKKMKIKLELVKINLLVHIVLQFMKNLEALCRK